ncbi:hypothetical protein ACFQ8C_02425 [Streptomyces sp. NPDC056503]|uniref:hypothetical protein n=1 Tax=Streptomyces sp. NPDC056503 TaxID=3345842 RepID=UPI0036B83787
MQISHSVTHLDGAQENVAQGHPAGEVTIGVGGRLGMRSRLLRASAADQAGYSADMPFTTMTITCAD